MKYLYFEQTIPVSLEQAWEFFSTPQNLNLITPPDMHFKILYEVPDKMYQGILILYEVSPFPFIKFKWSTEITVISHHNYFIDEQRTGPYKFWHHEHHFVQTDGGVVMTDKLYYKIGKSIFGWLAGKLFIHKKVQEIFEFRKKKLAELFGELK